MACFKATDSGVSKGTCGAVCVPTHQQKSVVIYNTVCRYQTDDIFQVETYCVIVYKCTEILCRWF